MDNQQTISREQFSRRVVELYLRSGLDGLPKNDADQHILLKSVTLTLGKPGVFSELELNEKLKVWINQVIQMRKFDHSSLRRWLVDFGYLTRNKDGSRYEVAAGSRAQLFDPSIDQVDIPQVIQAAREEIARKKQEYLAKSGRAG